MVDLSNMAYNFIPVQIPHSSWAQLKNSTSVPFWWQLATATMFTFTFSFPSGQPCESQSLAVMTSNARPPRKTAVLPTSLQKDRSQVLIPGSGPVAWEDRLTSDPVEKEARSLYLPTLLPLVAIYLTKTLHDLSFVPGCPISVQSWNSCQEYTCGSTAHQN